MALNATYLRPEIQNELIATCGEIIQKKLVDKINYAKCFSVLVDETTDISRQEQMSICVRYTNQNDNICMYITRRFFVLCQLRVQQENI